MSPQIVIALATVFLATALFIGTVTWYYLIQRAPGRRRLGQILQPASTTGLLLDGSQVAATPGAKDSVLGTLPGARNDHLRRQLALAGLDHEGWPVAFTLSRVILPVVLGLPALMLLEGSTRFVATAVAGIAGVMLPEFLLQRRLKKRKREIQNGLADCLDLLVLCLEAGSSLDQAIVKAGDELEVAYPALADQLRIVTTETRAGMTRLDAFRAFANRTKVDDVRALVAMLVQTDRFGTSVANALRTHATVCRTKRRQNAEEKAEKVGVKLVFPLVFCLFPAFYVVMLGPAYIRFMQAFGQM
jgi:tight adherence protein C